MVRCFLITLIMAISFQIQAKTIKFGDKYLVVKRENPVFSYSFGDVQELSVLYDEEVFSDYDAMILIGNEIFYMKTKGGTKLYNANHNHIESSRLKTCCTDEVKIRSLLEILKPGSRSSGLRLTVRFLIAEKLCSYNC